MDAVGISDVTDIQFEKPINDVLTADEIALIVISFWNNQLAMKLIMREDNK